MLENIQLDLEELISSQEGSLVSPIVPQENKTQKIIANSGMKCLELSKNLNPDGLLAKMSEILLTSEKDWYSSKCVLTWKVKVTKHKRTYYQLQQSTLPIKDTDVGFFPTPTAATNGPGKNPNNPRGIHQGNALATVVRMFPTPRVADTEGGLVKNVELKNGSFSRVNKDGVRWGVKLKDAVSHLEQKPGQLNSEWVELLMGYPKGWTDIGEVDGKKERQDLQLTKKLSLIHI